ncbi:hypothetical protein B0A49_10372 [Cryomyces minteri]|uniref:Zn(2)-C6 fungal-type domain-containing protein n=1 Tax=Cryomyces minteri TaxID=331657 RepID=A0A4U0VWW0_9PEZI|nr:hypothetical protein B0A49_10372 [Cryomyces minteri]
MPRAPLVPIAAARPHKQLAQEKDNLIKLKTIGAVANIRTRRERPCDACRRRKSRCVIHEGAALCVLCEFHKQDCTFVQSPQPRKRKLDTGEKSNVVMKKRPAASDPPANSPQNSSTTAKISKPPRPVEQKDTSILAETLGLQRRRHCRYVGRTTALDPTLIGLTQFDMRNESTFDLGTLRKVNEHEYFTMYPDEDSQTYGDDADALNAVEQAVSPYGPALIDIYFRTIHPSFPIIQEQVFLDRLRNHDRNFNPPLLAGMYILALNWWAQDPKLASLPKPDSKKLEEIASRSLASAMQRPKLSTMQAGLLMLQRPDADSWSLTTQLIAVGQELGLHLDCSDWAIPVWERGLRKRIAWALYIQDKWSSLVHGRPSHIFAANWAVKPITDDDFAEDAPVTTRGVHKSEAEATETARGQTIFMQMISLTAIMAEVVDTFYTQSAIRDFDAAGPHATRLILERVKPVQIKLKDWFAALPHSTRMASSNLTDNTTTLLSPTGYLHLGYFATEITLHRRIIQSLRPASTDPYLLHICRAAAKTRLISAMDFVNRLRPEHLRAFWYSASKINFTLIGTFGSLLWATAPGQEEADFYRTRLLEYRWTLSVSSKRAGFLDYAVQMLDASRGMLANLAEKPSLAQKRVSSAGVPVSGSVASSGGGAAVGGLPRRNHRAMDSRDGYAPHLRTYTPGPGPAFEGFASELLDQYGEPEPHLISPITTHSSIDDGFE